MKNPVYETKNIFLIKLQQFSFHSWTLKANVKCVKLRLQNFPVCETLLFDTFYGTHSKQVLDAVPSGYVSYPLLPPFVYKGSG